MYKTILILFHLCLPYLLQSQVIGTDVLVRAKSTEHLYRCLISILDLDFSYKIINEELHIAKVSFSDVITHQELNAIAKNHDLIFAVHDLYTSNRSVPNDVLYNQQWAIAFSKINKVWDITTGGKLYDGSDIVIGLLDDGFDWTHDDLKGNVFFNKGEKADDGVDNDNNGYLDDYLGYNVDTRNGDENIRTHGTGVAGIMGASGNNSIGMTGINWNTKILPVTGVNKLSEIIEGYTYFLKMRRLYNNTKGAKGAKIMVVNYSGGISGVFSDVEPYRTWCQLYDMMGQEGIISVGATVNENADVAVSGDMPSTCLSEFLIVTTNIDKTGTKVKRAGFSKEYITMAAPGESLLTTDTNNKFENEFSGTSAAAPMIAGTIALLYSIPCSQLSTVVDSDPLTGIKLIKQALKESVVKTNKLADETRWGGYLDALNAMLYLSKDCDNIIVSSPKGPMEIKYAYQLNHDVHINYLTPDEEDKYRLVAYNALGQIIFNEKIAVPSVGEKRYVLRNQQYKGILFVSLFNELTKEVAAIKILIN